MQSLGDLFANNRLLAIGVVLAAIAVILAVGVALFRLVFGRRLHMSGGRTRQPRLGVVDAFDLDRQRQLVLIRRDNIEHLLMIGGPNDVLIEAAIVRAPVAVAGRDKDNGFSPSVGIPAPMAQQPALPVATPAPLVAASVPAGGPEGGATMPLPAPIPAEPRFASTTAAEPTRPTPVVETHPPQPAAAASQDTRLPAANTLPPAGPRPMSPTPAARSTSPLPPRPPVTPVSRPVTGPTPRANLPRATPVAPPATGHNPEPRQPGRVEPVMGRGTVEPSASSSERPVPEPSRDPIAPVRFPQGPARRPEAQPPLATSAETGRSAAEQAGASPSADDAMAPRPTPPARPTPSLPNRTLPPRPVSTPPAPTGAPAPSRAPLPSMSSLEEEMAKLLGRPMPPPDTTGSNS